MRTENFTERCVEKVNGGMVSCDCRTSCGINLEGNGITAEIRSATGVILVKGKNITVNVSNSSVEKLIVINVSTKVNNLTDEDIKITLANGAKITVPAKHVYNTNDNTVQKK
jgi:hypothetical protein